MKYYRVKTTYDNVAKRRFVRNNCIMDDVYIGGELFTIKEMEKHQKNHLLPAPLNEMTDLVEIPKNEVFWSFGARFKMKGE